MMTTQIQLKMYKAIIMPALIYAMEAWSKFEIKDLEKFDILQKKSLNQFLNVQNNTFLGSCC